MYKKEKIYIYISMLSLAGRAKLPFKNDVLGDCVLGDFQMLQTFFGALPQICASTQSCLGSSMGNVFNLIACFFSLTCNVKRGTYIDRSVSYQIVTNQLNYSQVDSNQVVDTSQG
jgi:hypothetical protein